MNQPVLNIEEKTDIIELTADDYDLLISLLRRIGDRLTQDKDSFYIISDCLFTFNTRVDDHKEFARLYAKLRQKPFETVYSALMDDVTAEQV